MYEIKDHPVFDEVMRRIETDDFTISYHTEWFFSEVTIRFKSGFCKGIRFELHYDGTGFDPKPNTALSLKTYVSSGFLSATQYIDPDKLPVELKEAIIWISDNKVAEEKKIAAANYEKSMASSLNKAFD